VSVHNEPSQEDTVSHIVLHIGDAFAQCEHMKYTIYSVPNGGCHIEVSTMADGSLGGDNIMRRIGMHVSGP
jgi:hypothetical protein